MNRNCPLVKTCMQFDIKYNEQKKSKIKSEVTTILFHFSFLGTINKLLLNECKKREKESKFSSSLLFK